MKTFGFNEEVDSDPTYSPLTYSPFPQGNVLKGNFCWSCTAAEGNLASVSNLDSLFKTSYQLDKFTKHTQPACRPGVNSLFFDLATVSYANYLTTTLASGSATLDYWGKPSFVWYARENLGWTYVNNVFRCPSDAVKVVLPYEKDRIHAYPVPAGDYAAIRCAKCGKPILA